MTRHLNTTYVVRIGLALEAFGLLAVTYVVKPDVTFLQLLPGLICFGLGLGLAIVSELVAAMAGTVRAESPVTETGGTRFVVTLPGSSSTSSPRPSAAPSWTSWRCCSISNRDSDATTS